MAKINNDFFNLQICFVLTLVFLLTACASPFKKEKRVPEAQLYIDLGLRYMEIGDYGEALTNLQKSYAIDDKYFASHNALAIFYGTTGKKKLAITYFKQALNLAPENPSILNNYGRFLCQQGSIEQGFEMLMKAAKLPVNDRAWLSYNNAGRCQILKGNQKLAEQQFKQALERNNRFSPALFELAALNYAQGKFLLARHYMKQFFAVHSETADSVFLAYKIEKELDRLAEEHYYQVLKKKFPTSREITTLVQ